MYSIRLPSVSLFDDTVTTSVPKREVNCSISISPIAQMNSYVIWMCRTGCGQKAAVPAGSRSFSLLVLFMTFLPAVISPSLSAAQDLQNSPGEVYRTALKLFQQGLYAESISGFRLVAEDESNSTLAEAAGYHLVLAVSKADSSRLEEMTEWFVHQHPNSRRAGDLLNDLGETYRRGGEYRRALHHFERALEAPMTRRVRTELIYRMAETAADDQSYEEAREYFLALADRYPESHLAPGALYARGRLLLEEEKYDEASQAFELLRSRYPD